MPGRYAAVPGPRRRAARAGGRERGPVPHRPHARPSSDGGTPGRRARCPGGPLYRTRSLHRRWGIRTGRSAGALLRTARNPRDTRASHRAYRRSMDPAARRSRAFRCRSGDGGGARGGGAVNREGRGRVSGSPAL